MQLNALLKEVQDSRGTEHGTLQGKLDLHQYLTDAMRTHYFINPVIAFLPLLLFISGVAAFLISMFFPGTSRLSWIRSKVINAYEGMESSMRKQSESHATDFEYLMSLPTVEREEHIRRSTLPEVVIAEIHDLIAIRNSVQSVLAELGGSGSAVPPAGGPSRAGAILERIKKTQRRFWKL